MPKFGSKSTERLLTCHTDIIRVFNEVIKHVDCSILEGHRGEKLQNRYYKAGNSKVEYPDGKHNGIPSLAIDCVPYPVDWKDDKRFHLFAGFVLGIAKQLNINLRWGGCWKNDFNPKENNFYDAPHFELIK